MAKEIVWRFNSINKRQKILIKSSGGIGYLGKKRNLERSTAQRFSSSIGNHRWYIFLDIQLRFSYIQLTQNRVPIKKYVLKGGCQDAGISN